MKLNAATSTLGIISRRMKSKGITILNPSADVLPYKGKPAGKCPIKVNLEPNKTYAWCACGLSTNQPFCDGKHKLNGLTMARPVLFTVDAAGEYRLCGCKQTESRPVCDGCHKTVPPQRNESTQFVQFGSSPVYDGVAHKLGYKPKHGGFQ